MKQQVSAIILSGGQGRRFDGQDKGLVLWQDKPLIQHVIERLEPQVSRIVISCHRHFDRYQALGFTTKTDLDEDHLGPLAGVQAAYEAITTPWCLLCPNDVPKLPENLVQRLLDTAVSSDCQVAYPVCDEQRHYLPALVSSELLGSCRSYLQGGGRSLKHWYRDFTVSAVDFSSQSLLLTNVNSADTLAQLSED